jgi:poly-gamma-glutamate synthesis protein (capsule biosynthesis protein)
MKKILVLLIMSFLLSGCDSNVNVTEENPPEVQETEKRVSFYGVGDNLIHNCVYFQADRYKEGPDFDFKPMYEKVSNDIKNADISYINQETILGGTELTLSSYPLFNSPKELGRDMIELGFDIFSHATNHVFDKGEKGIENTYNFYQDKDVIFTGIHKKGEDNIKITEKNGIKFAFLNYTYITNGLSLRKDSSYYVPLADKEKMAEDIKRAKDMADFVVMFAHWGNENQTTPSTEQKEDAKLFAELGCDAIIGTHPHAIQPVEFIDDTLVVYSLGNFISAQKNHVNLIGGTVKFDFVLKGNEKKIENVEFKPVINHYNSGFANIKIIPFEEYSEDLARTHGAGISYEYIKKIINKQMEESNLSQEEI